MLHVLFSTIVFQLLAPSPPDPFAFFRPDVEMGATERRAIASGEPVISILPSQGHEIAVFTAIPINGQLTADHTAGWLQQIEQLRRNRYVLASGRLSMPPRVEDLNDLTLDAEDLDGIRRCRPGHCDVKLTASEIGELQRVIATASRDWQLAVQDAFRALVARRVTVYLSGGHAALGAYADRQRPRVIADAFMSLLGHTPFLRNRLPAVVDAAVTCPAASILDGSGFVYWAKERLGGKAVVSVTHVTVVRGDGVSSPEAMALSIQLFATHYLDASLGVTAILRDPVSARKVFVYMNRSDVDILRGIWRGIARSLIESRIRRDGPEILRAVDRRIAGRIPVHSSADVPLQRR
jgi:hypothetical protein